MSLCLGWVLNMTDRTLNEWVGRYGPGQPGRLRAGEVGMGGRPTRLPLLGLLGGVFLKMGFWPKMAKIDKS